VRAVTAAGARQWLVFRWKTTATDRRH